MNTIQTQAFKTTVRCFTIEPTPGCARKWQHSPRVVGNILSHSVGLLRRRRQQRRRRFHRHLRRLRQVSSFSGNEKFLQCDSFFQLKKKKIKLFRKKGSSDDFSKWMKQVFLSCFSFYERSTSIDDFSLSTMNMSCSNNVNTTLKLTLEVSLSAQLLVYRWDLDWQWSI